MRKILGITLCFFWTFSLSHAQNWALHWLDDAEQIATLKLEQSQEGVTVTVEKLYADAHLVAIWYSITGIELPEGRYIGFPIVDVQLLKADGTAFGTRGMDANLDMESAAVWQGYVSFNHDEVLVTNPLNLNFEVKIGVSEDFPFYIVPKDFPMEGSIPEKYRYDFPYEQTYNFDLPVEFAPTQVYELDLSQESDGLSMSISKLELSPAQIYLTLCYDLPSNADWQAELIIQAGTMPVQPLNAGLFSPPALDISTPRCTRLDFATIILETTTELDIRVEYLKTPYPTMPSETIFTNAQAVLAEMAISADYQMNDGGLDILITEKPATMSSEEAQMHAYGALRERYPVNWHFTIPLSAAD